MAVSRSGLAAGYPPFMPLYMGWTDCFAHLRSQKQLKRGSSLLFRYYTGPQVRFWVQYLVGRNEHFDEQSLFSVAALYEESVEA